MKRKRKAAPVQIEPGKWYALGKYDRTICCDCALHHRVAYKLEAGRIFERVTLDPRATKRDRAKHGIIVLRKDQT
jgi:hypothetical protein